jgi:hypothetical protein
MMKKIMMFAALAVSMVAIGGITTPLDYDDPKYLRDWYAPPPDWVPIAAPANFTPNTRIPEIVWVEYKGSYGPGLKIAPIKADIYERLQKEGIVTSPQRLRVFNINNEKSTLTREVSVVASDFKKEWAKNITNLTFRLKSKAVNAGSNVKVNIPGMGCFFTDKCEAVTKEGDVTTYSFPISGGKPIHTITITVDPITEWNKDTVQEITIFDFHLKSKKIYAPFKSPAPRRFVESNGKVVDDICEHIKNTPASDTMELPVNKWTKPNDENNTGVEYAVVKEKFGSETLDALKITWTKPTGKRKHARVAFSLPKQINTLNWNVMSFYYKIETPAGAKVLGDAPINRIPQYFLFDCYLDNPGISFSSKEDRSNWNVYGVTRQHLSSGRQLNAKAPAGWKFFACDLVNDDPTGNKWFSLDKIDTYEISLRNSNIKEGEKVVFTILMPKVTRGVTYSGGDTKLWEEFKVWKKNYKPRDYKDALADDVWKQGRLVKPVPVMRNRIANIEIVSGDRSFCVNPIGRQYAANLLKDQLQRVLQPLNDIPIRQKKASTNDTVKLYLGLPKDAPANIVEALQAFRKKNAKTPATFIANEGKNFYFDGCTDFKTVGNDKGIINGILDFLEANCGIVWPRPVILNATRRNKMDDCIFSAIYPTEQYKDFDFTWGGDYVAKPVMLHWGYSNGDEKYTYLNRGNFHGCWYGRPAIDFSCYRSYAANHWFGYGGGNTENEKWGMDDKGKRLRPGCYTSTPCLINVMEDGKKAFLFGKFGHAINGLDSSRAIYKRYNDDAMPCWIEDTWNTCQCPKCLAPFRLPDGSLITKDDPDFKAEAHMVNAAAYNHAVRVYANRNSELNYLVYFYTIPVPRTPVSRYVRAHFCPYVRVNYTVPIYAPVNDKFWRIITQWCQVARSMGISEYYLGGHFRPFADVQGFDLKAYREVGVTFYGQETETSDRSFMEMWVGSRKLYRPDLDTDAVRAYYCSRTFGAGGKYVYDFYAKLRALRYSEFRDTDFEETGWGELGWLAKKTPSNAKGCANLVEELTRDLENARKAAKGNPANEFFVERVYKGWLSYLEWVNNDKIR